MHFVVAAPYQGPRVTPPVFPTVVLERDNWDDYHYRTMFKVKLHLDQSRVLDLENVKVLAHGQERGPTPIPDSFDSLGEEFCSLGQAVSYYESLASAGAEVYEPYLRSLRDVAFLPDVRGAFEDEPGFETSLLRFDGARRALEDAAFVLRGQVGPAAALSFSYLLPGEGEPITFAFGQQDGLPDRLCVLIGYNGAGKTFLLGELAHVAYADARRAEMPDFVSDHGRYVGQRPEFGAVIAISYSAFDTFELPGRHGSHRASERNYTYCGLRQVGDAGEVSRILKDLDQLGAEFHDARGRALERDRASLLIAAVEPLLKEPSFRTTVELPDIEARMDAWEDSFASLSAGHKIALNVVVQLCAYLERRSLILLDEPELHLHPPLLAALLRAIGVALERYDSFGVLATHSPVVLQEVPARNVIVLRRSLDLFRAEEPYIETFAESVGLLTRHVFNLDSRETDYRAVLEGLAQTMPLEQIAALFPRGMSAQARSLILAFTRGPEDE
jgi:predicted ATPase